MLKSARTASRIGRAALVPCLIISLFPIAVFAQMPAITRVWFTDVSHSVVLVHFNSEGSWKFLRLRYIQSPGTCTGGKGGSVQLTGYEGQLHLNVGMTEPLGGLLANTTYQVCPEISPDNSKWFFGAAETLTTLPLPNPHPALPIPPRTFDTSYPNTSGYNSVTVASDCHDFMSQLKTALKNQVTSGTLINIPAGTVCRGQYYIDQQAADVVAFKSSAVSTANGSIRLPNHGYSEGQGLMFGTVYGALPGPQAIEVGQLYYAHVVDENTIQIYRSAPMASGGKLCTFSNPGNGTNLVVKWPRPLKWIIVRTATPDAQFDPEHVRVIPAWHTKMATFCMPNTYLGISSKNVLFKPSDQDGNVMYMNANIRFVGIEFTYTPSPEALLTSNPVPHFNLVDTERFNQNIIFDRCWFHALEKPDRTFMAFWWNGMNQAIVDCYISGMQFYHPMYSGLTVKRNSNSQFTIAPGSYHWGAGSATLKSAVTVDTSGNSGPNSKAGFVYFTMAGQLNIALPPGVIGTCAGAPCHVFTSSNTPGNGLFASGTGVAPKQAGGNNYWVDPIFSSSSSCKSQTSLFNRDADPPGTFHAAGRYEIGVMFSSESNGYICGVAFYKDSSEIGTHRGTLWTADGRQLATSTFTRETASGWQQVNFDKPAAVQPNTSYIVSYDTNVGLFLSAKYFQNAMYDNPPLHTVAHYANANGTCNYSDSWPKDFLGNVAAAQVGCITFNNGAIIAARNANSVDTQYASEGCQCMVGGIGPGPYAFINNYVEGTGVVWHHDDSGGALADRGDYYYYRNTFRAPLSQMYGGAQSDGLRYFHRQALEWKAGQRILLNGNIFDGAWVEDTPFGEFIDFSSVSGQGIRDVDMQNNTFQHGASVLFSPSQITGGTLKVAPPIRFRFQNNLVWDITGKTYCTYGQGFCPQWGGHGVIFAASQGAEDWTINHNTIIGNTGAQPSLLWMSDTRVEGLNFTNNIFHLSPGFGEGISATNVVGTKGKPCGNLFGKEAADCALQNYVFEHNLLTGTEDRKTIESWWPGLKNYVPSHPSDLSVVGKPSRNASMKVDQYELKPDLPSEWNGYGADVNALEAAQGKVNRVDVPPSSITSTSATVMFVAPDKAGCPIDYSNTDASLIHQFTRINDAGGKADRNIVLSQLSPNTLYYYRVNCAVQQPMGQFRTR